MAKTFISFVQLQQILTEFVAYLAPVDPPARQLSEFLMNTGIRINEAYNTSWWLDNDPETFILYPEKGNNPRLIEKNLIPAYFIDCYNSQIMAYQNIRFSTFSRFFRAYLPHYPLRHDGKVLTSHLFRHYKMKKLYDDGLDIASIAAYMGEVESNTVQGYVFSDLYYIS